MKVFLVATDLRNYRPLVSRVDKILDVIEKFDGRIKLQSGWRPLPVGERTPDGRRSMSDYPIIARNMPMFSDKAKNCLQDLLAGSGEWLELDCRENRYWAFNVIAVCNALVVSRSVVTRFESGVVESVDEYVLDGSKIDSNVAMFKIPETAQLETLVTESFVHAVEQCGLKGFEFKPVKVM